MPTLPAPFAKARARRRVEPPGGPHRLTGSQMQVLQPPGGAAPDAGGALSGIDLHSRHWVRTDPFMLYQAGHISSPHRAIAANLRWGKSSLVKTDHLRARRYGRRIVVIDVKDEWPKWVAAVRRCAHNVDPGDRCDLCPSGESAGSGARVTHVTLSPGGGVIINPLDVPDQFAERPDRRLNDSQRRQAQHAYRTSVVTTIAAAGMGRLTPVQHDAVSQAVAEATRRSGGHPTIPHVVAELSAPSDAAVEATNLDVDTLKELSRDVAAELRKYVTGSMAGIFDGPTSPGVSPTDDVVVLSMPDLFGSEQQAAVMAGIGGWIIGGLADAAARRVNTLMTMEEAWSLLRTPSTALFFTRVTKLASLWNVSLGWTIHQFQDLDATGDKGTEQQELARGLVSHTQIQWIGAQARGQLPLTQTILGASDEEIAAVSRLQSHQWLRRVNGVPSLVQHRLAAVERDIVDTELMG